MPKCATLWELTNAALPLRDDFIRLDVGPDVVAKGGDALVAALKLYGGVGLLAATQRKHTQNILYDGGVGLYAKYCRFPRVFKVYFKCLNGWRRTKLPVWDPAVPIQRVHPIKFEPIETEFLEPPCPKTASVERVNARSLRVMKFLVLTEVIMSNEVIYWKDVNLDEPNAHMVENCFGDIPSTPCLITFNYAAVMVDGGVARYFDPIVDVETRARVEWHANRANLTFVLENSEQRPLEDVYTFVYGRAVPNLEPLSMRCLDKNKPIK